MTQGTKYYKQYWTKFEIEYVFLFVPQPYPRHLTSFLPAFPITSFSPPHPPLFPPPLLSHFSFISVEKLPKKLFIAKVGDYQIVGEDLSYNVLFTKKIESIFI